MASYKGVTTCTAADVQARPAALHEHGGLLGTAFYTKVGCFRSSS